MNENEVLVPILREKIAEMFKNAGYSVFRTDGNPPDTMYFTIKLCSDGGDVETVTRLSMKDVESILEDGRRAGLLDVWHNTEAPPIEDVLDDLRGLKTKADDA